MYIDLNIEINNFNNYVNIIQFFLYTSLAKKKIIERMKEINVPALNFNLNKSVN